MKHFSASVLICLFLHSICCGVAIYNDATFRYKGKYGFKTKDYEVIVPTKVDENGQHKSFSIPHHFLRFAKSKARHVYKRDADKVYYRIPISDGDHYLELEPNRDVLSPGMIVETHHNNEGNGKLKRFSDNRCQFTGSVKNHDDSRVALSTCDGLTGYIRTDRGYYIIEPLAGHNLSGNNPHPHALYKQGQELFHRNPTCATNSRISDVCLTKKSVNKTLDANLTELHIEALAVLDRSILQYHKEIDIENFILTVFNIASDLFHDDTLGVNINLAIVRMIRLEYEDHEVNIAINRNPEKTLDYFSKWQAKINPREDFHPNHHDIALLLTRIDICGDDKTCGLLGAAKLAGICDPQNQAVICQDNGLRMGFTIAHEIGHALGLIHDTVIDSTQSTTVMSPFITPSMVKWSNCSRIMLRNFFDSGFGACLYDPPTDHSFELVNALPGVMYDGDYQCREIFGPNAALCMTGLECGNLICYIEDKGCVESHIQPAEGTSCGANKWCFHGECVEIGERPNATDGGWGPWSEWSECTRTCGSGVSSQERHCNSPQPSGTGKYCQGEHRRHRICSTEPCELGEPSFRDLQCAEFNSWLYPEDQKIHQWKSYPIHDENPCGLYCVNELGAVAVLRPRVIDGTTCYRGIRDICINGLCKEIPCDLDLQSNAVEDRCGVCKGDGTSCTIIRGEKLFTCIKDIGEKKFIEIPKGAFNIKIEELMPSESRIEVRDQDGANIFITGDSLGSFTVEGSKAWVGMIRTKQEAISIPGPIKLPISVWVGLNQNCTIKYTYAIGSKKNHTTQFSWDILDWTHCSAECGSGTQESVIKCVEKHAGLVDESNCKHLTKPKHIIRPCEIAPCIPRWYIGDFQDCSKCPRGVRTRIVKCIRPVGTGEGQLDIVPDTFCPLPKPRSSGYCKCHVTSKPSKSSKSSTQGAAETTPPMVYKNIVDFYNNDLIKLTVHTELEGNKIPAGLPHPKTATGTSYELDGKEALKFLNKMEVDFSNNKTKI